MSPEAQTRNNNLVNASIYFFGDSTIKLLATVLGDSTRFRLVRHRFTFVVRRKPMAVFQYSLELLPFDDTKLYARILGERKLDGTQTQIWNPQPSLESLKRLRALLPIGQPWGPCEEYISSNDTWSSDLRIWHRDDERNYVNEIAFRISAVHFSLSYLSSIVAIPNDFNWNIGMLESQRVCHPSVESILADFQSSRAARFLNDPKTAIIEASEEIDVNADRG